MNRIPETSWKWFGNAGHLIVGRWCRFHLCTLIGQFLISTVGEYWPDRKVREIHAEVHDKEWFTENVHLKGDAFDYAYMKRFGYEEIGCDRKYETMCFKTTGGVCSCGCGLPKVDFSELDMEGYNDAESATKGHYLVCERWASPLESTP